MSFHPKARRYTIRVPVTKDEDEAVKAKAEELATTKAGLIRRALFGLPYEIERLVNPRQEIQPTISLGFEEDGD